MKKGQTSDIYPWKKLDLHRVSDVWDFWIRRLWMNSDVCEKGTDVCGRTQTSVKSGSDVSGYLTERASPWIIFRRLIYLIQTSESALMGFLNSKEA